MSLSSIAVEQREKEAKTLNSFLAFSLIGSLALHIGVLSLGIGKFLSKAPAPENEPIEIAIVELLTPQKLESKPEKVKTDSVVGNDRAILSNSGGSEGFGVASGGGASLPKKIAPTNSSISTAEVIKAQPAPQQKPSQRISRTISTPPQNQKIKLVTPSQAVPTKPVETPAKTPPSEIVTQPKPEIAPSPVSVARAKPVATSNSPVSDRSSQIQQLNNRRLNNLLANTKTVREQASTVSNSREIAAQQGSIAANLRNQSRSGAETSNSLGNSAGNESRNGGTGSTNSIGISTGNGTNPNDRGTGTGTGNGTNPNDRGTGNGTGTGTRKGTNPNNGLQSGSTVATGTRNVERATSPGESNSNTNTGSSGRLACRTCSKPKYPESARKRKLEGKAEISVDVDSKGNVTNVRLARTSGHAELDKAAVEQARNWKFNTPNGSEQGVTAKVDFAIEGSKRSRQNRDRRRQRAAGQKKPVVSSQNTRSQTTPITNTNNALRRSLRRQSTAVRRQRVDTLPPRQALDKPQRRQQSVLRRSPSQTRLRDTLRRSQPQTSPSQTKLRQSLRLHQQKSQSTLNEP